MTNTNEKVCAMCIYNCVLNILGMTKLEVVTAHIVVQTMVGIIQASILLVVCYGFYDNPMRGSIFLIILLMLFLEMMGLWYGKCYLIKYNLMNDDCIAVLVILAKLYFCIEFIFHIFDTSKFGR